MISTSTILSLCSDGASGMRIFAGSFSSVGATKKAWPSNRSCADDGFPRSLDDADDTAFGASARFPVGDLHLHLISVHRRARQRGRNEDVAVDARDFFEGTTNP